MIRNNIVAIAATSARAALKHQVGTEPERELMVAAFTEALGNFLAPTEEEAFMAGTAAIIDLFPDRRAIILAEAQSIGDRSKVLSALMNGVPVDMDRVVIAPFPEEAVDLVALFGEAQATGRAEA